jgi:hypothetical protein
MSSSTSGPVPPGVRIVEGELAGAPAPLVRPNGYGYVHVAAELERPHPVRRQSSHRRRIREQVVAATAGFAKLEGVRRVDVFDAVLLPPGAEEGRKRLAEAGHPVRSAAYDLVVLVECESVQQAVRIREHATMTALLGLLSSAQALHCAVMSNARRIAEVDKTRGGIFLFNYFFTPKRSNDEDAREIMLAVWEHTAGWFTEKANLDNSTLLVPIEGQPSSYTVVNHCRWDGLLDIVPHLVLRPSLRRFVLGNFDANDIVAMPVLYRVVAHDGVPVRRPIVGGLVMGLGVLHALATLPLVFEVLPSIAANGFFGGVARDMPPPPEAMPAIAALFSSVMAVLLLVAGGLLVRLQRTGNRVPAWLGPVLLLTGLGGGLLLPASGFWLVAALGLWLSLRRPR